LPPPPSATAAHCLPRHGVPVFNVRFVGLQQRVPAVPLTFLLFTYTAPACGWFGRSRYVLPRSATCCSWCYDDGGGVAGGTVFLAGYVHHCFLQGGNEGGGGRNTLTCASCYRATPTPYPVLILPFTYHDLLLVLPCCLRSAFLTYCCVRCGIYIILPFVTTLFLLPTVSSTVCSVGWIALWFLLPVVTNYLLPLFPVVVYSLHLIITVDCSIG
jgi:hypothetical protein